jgi:hypothetical protein
MGLGPKTEATRVGARQRRPVVYRKPYAALPAARA